MLVLVDAGRTDTGQAPRLGFDLLAGLNASFRYFAVGAHIRFSTTNVAWFMTGPHIEGRI